jgi:hypothetical protein
MFSASSSPRASSQEWKKKTLEELSMSTIYCKYYLSIVIVEVVEEQTEAAAQKLSHKIFDSVNSNVWEVSSPKVSFHSLLWKIYQGEGRLEAELRRFQKAVNDLSFQLDRWQSTLKPIENALKELGDVENWSSVLDERVSELVE